MPLRRLLLLALVLLLLPEATALSLIVEEGAVLGDVRAPPGEPLHIDALGRVTITGLLITQPSAASPDAPSITIRAGGDIVLHRDAQVRAGDGNDGAAATGVYAQGGDGGKGGDIVLEAQNIIAEGAHLRAGDGGRGGDAWAIWAHDAIAIGGDGGAAGEVMIIGSVIGTVDIVHGRGGDGGDAQAQGGPGAATCTSLDGDSASADGEARQAGDGGDAQAIGEEGGCGAPDATAGSGGDAVARGGNGGVSSAGVGGNGGTAIAIAGKGGDGADACYDTYERALSSGLDRAGNGGLGGRYSAVGGDGGSGITGGDGGMAVGQSLGGRGGNATTPPLQVGAGGGLKSGNEARAGSGGSGVTAGEDGVVQDVALRGAGGHPCGASAESTQTPGVPSVALWIVLAVGLLLVRARQGRNGPSDLPPVL